MNDYWEIFEVEDRSSSGDWMKGTGQECIDFIVLVRRVSREDAIHIVTLARAFGEVDMPQIEIFVKRGSH